MANPEYRRLSQLDPIETLTRDHRVPMFLADALAGYREAAAILALLERADLEELLFAADTAFDPAGTGMEAETVQAALAELATGSLFLRKSENGADILDAATFRASLGLSYADEAARRQLRSDLGARLNGFLHGLTLSNAADTEHDITVLPGVAASDDASPAMMRLVASLTKRADEAFAEGDNAGGMVAGEGLPTNGTIHANLIGKADGAVDLCYNNHASSGLSPALPTGFIYKRRIASLCTDAAANIHGFIQTGDVFTYKLAKADAANAAQAGSATTRTLTVPAGLKVEALLSVLTYGTTNGYTIFTDLDLGTITAAIGNLDVYNPANVSVSANLRVMTNTSRQISTSTSTLSGALWINTKGYVDTRGRLA